MPGLDRSIVEHRFPINLVLDLISNLPEKSTKMKYWLT
jgi:hypothetical protein